jgi:hypothetical protein
MAVGAALAKYEYMPMLPTMRTVAARARDEPDEDCLVLRDMQGGGREMGRVHQAEYFSPLFERCRKGGVPIFCTVATIGAQE